MPLDVKETKHPSVESHPLDTDTFSPDDPKALLQAILKYLSDVELFNLVITRLGKSAPPQKTPLYLTTLCIEGVHDFFRPLKPGTDPIQLATPASADVSIHNPFNKMPITRRDSERLTGKFNLPSARKNSPALLLSLATLISFLEPAELRTMIQKRISDSSTPHRPIACFLEFLQSGGDETPWGQLRMLMKRSKVRENVKRRRLNERAGHEQAEGSRAGSVMGPKGNGSAGAAGASNVPGISTTDANTNPPPSYADIELEEGEISPNGDIDAPALPTHTPTTAISDQGGAPAGTHVLDPGIAPSPPKKKRKRNPASQRRARAQHAVLPMILS